MLKCPSALPKQKLTTKTLALIRSPNVEWHFCFWSQKAREVEPNTLFRLETQPRCYKAISVQMNMISCWETGTRSMFSTIATTSNYPQMLTSQNVGSPHLFGGGRFHYNEAVLEPGVNRFLVHFIAACWTFTINTPNDSKSLMWETWRHPSGKLSLIAADTSCVKLSVS